MDLHLRGKRVLITGASKGIGAAAEKAARVLLPPRSGAQLKALTERLRSAHQIDASAHVVDLRTPADLAKLVRTPPPSTFSSQMPAIFPAVRSTRSMRRPGVTPGS